MTVPSATSATGQACSVDLRALGVGTPGIGAFTVDISYDTGTLSALSCASPENQGLGFCNANFADNQVRAVGAVAEGVSGDVTLATITFECRESGSSELTISVDTLADATVGNPTDITYTAQNGTLTCS